MVVMAGDAFGGLWAVAVIVKNGGGDGALGYDRGGVGEREAAAAAYKY